MKPVEQITNHCWEFSEFFFDIEYGYHVCEYVRQFMYFKSLDNLAGIVLLVNHMR